MNARGIMLILERQSPFCQVLQSAPLLFLGFVRPQTGEIDPAGELTADTALEGVRLVTCGEDLFVDPGADGLLEGLLGSAQLALEDPLHRGARFLVTVELRPMRGWSRVPPTDRVTSKDPRFSKTPARICASSPTLTWGF